MLDHWFDTNGINTKIEIQDQTDARGNLVDLWMYGPNGDPMQMPWSYSLDGGPSSVQSYNFVPSNSVQHIGFVYVGLARQFTFHLGNAGPYIGGPQDFTIDLYRGSGLKTVTVKVGTEQKRAIAYVNVGGVWQPANAMIKTPDGWKSTS